MNKVNSLKKNKVTASIVGTCEDVSAHIQKHYPKEIISVIVWTADEVMAIADDNELTLNDEEVISVLGDIANNEIHEHGQDELSALSYIRAVKGISD